MPAKDLDRQASKHVNLLQTFVSKVWRSQVKLRRSLQLAQFLHVNVRMLFSCAGCFYCQRHIDTQASRFWTTQHATSLSRELLPDCSINSTQLAFQ